jgi:hypothetical protein
MTVPYYADDLVTLYHGRFEEVLPELSIDADLIIADPPYGETTLTWDRWPKGWPSIAAQYGRSMWCFGSMRMFLDQRDEFADWRFSQDVVWEKHNGSGLNADRFKRVHEHALHWYRGPWSEIHHDVPTTADATARTVRRKAKPNAAQPAGPRPRRRVVNPYTEARRIPVDLESPCDIWTGNLAPTGYGRVMLAGRTFYVHRVAYQLHVGPIPRGWECDHLCHNAAFDAGLCVAGPCVHRACFNPAHLDAVTSAINSARGGHPLHAVRRQSVCRNGHDLTDPANVKLNGTKRRCRICENAASRRRRAEKETQG